MMEEISEEEKHNELQPNQEEDAPQRDGENLSKAEEIIAQQTSQGLENQTPNPILNRPYQRMAPDLDKISYGFCFLSDINMDSILNFTQGQFLKGIEKIPRNLYGALIWPAPPRLRRLPLWRPVN